MNLNKSAALVLLALLVAVTAHAQTKAIQYKKYFIPVLNKVLFAGQSNAARMTDDLIYFNTKYSEYSSFSSVSENEYASWGGSALLEANRGSANNYWIKQLENGPDGSRRFENGPRLNELLNDGETNHDFIVWIQGEADGTKIETSSEKDDYKEGLSYVFDQMKEHLFRSGDAIFAIIVTGRRLTGSGTMPANKDSIVVSDKNRHGIQFVRQAQHELSEVRSDVVVISDAYDIALEPELSFDVHYTAAGRRKVLDRIAKSSANYFGEQQAFLPIPKIKSVTLNSNNDKELLVEIEGAEDLFLGVNSNVLLSAHLGEVGGNRVNVFSTQKISDSSVLLVLENGITDSYVFHVAYESLMGIEGDDSMQIRNEHLLPLSSGRFSISSGTW